MGESTSPSRRLSTAIFAVEAGGGGLCVVKGQCDVSGFGSIFADTFLRSPLFEREPAMLPFPDEADCARCAVLGHDL